MPNISPVIIHKPDSCHGWGIEFNKERPFCIAITQPISSMIHLQNVL